MRTGRTAICSFKQTFTTTGFYYPYLEVGSAVANAQIPLAAAPVLWSLQVTGYNGSNVITSPTSWTVYLLGSLDGAIYTTTSAIITHVNTAQANGDVNWSPGGSATAAAQFRGVRYVALDVNALSLGSATKIVVTAEGY